MLKVGHLLETCIYGTDLAAMERFYADTLGLDKILAEYPRWVFFRVSEQSVLLIFNPQESRKVREVPSHGATGPGHLGFAIEEPDLDAWREALGARGVAVEQEVTWPNGARSLYFRDPAGNSVELITGNIWGSGQQQAKSVQG